MSYNVPNVYPPITQSIFISCTCNVGLSLLTSHEEEHGFVVVYTWDYPYLRLMKKYVALLLFKCGDGQENMGLSLPPSHEEERDLICCLNVG